MVEQVDSESLDKLKAELRRGVIVLAVLAQLREEHYGYSLRKTLADAGVMIEEGTLYPLVRRLDRQGWLESQWRMEGGRNKRFYHLSPSGAVALKVLSEEWEGLNQGVQRLLGESPKTTERRNGCN